MSREVCQSCLRPVRACICQFFQSITNNVPVVVLQHPSEIKQTKGSLSLLENSLSQCQVIVGEVFDESEEFKKLSEIFSGRLLLLYPQPEAIELSSQFFAEQAINEPLQDYCLVLLDATWKKAYRMFMLSDCLQCLPSVSLPEGFVSQYHIRKTKKMNAFSTLEACCFALGLLESNADKYQPLLDSFARFNQQQLDFRSNGDK